MKRNISADKIFYNPIFNGMKSNNQRYFSSKEIPSVRNGLGVGIITTSKGVLTDKEAREHGVGGELICTVF